MHCTVTWPAGSEPRLLQESFLWDPSEDSNLGQLRTGLPYLKEQGMGRDKKTSEQESKKDEAGLARGQNEAGEALL